MKDLRKYIETLLDGLEGDFKVTNTKNIYVITRTLNCHGSIVKTTNITLRRESRKKEINMIMDTYGFKKNDYIYKEIEINLPKGFISKYDA